MDSFRKINLVTLRLVTDQKGVELSDEAAVVLKGTDDDHLNTDSRNGHGKETVMLIVTE